MLSADDKLTMERIEEDFKYAPLNGEQSERYVRLRQKAKEMALLIIGLCPESRERSSALTRLQECTFWANAAIKKEE